MPTGVRLGKRQAEARAGRAAADVEDFYARRRPHPGAGRDLLVLSADGKGIVMRPEALRAATAKAAASATTKLSTRLSKGEKRNPKRLAEVGAVYDADPVVRTPADILARGEHTDPKQPAQAPVAANKRLTASIPTTPPPWSAASSTRPTAATPPTRVPAGHDDIPVA